MSSVAAILLVYFVIIIKMVEIFEFLDQFEQVANESELL